MAEKTLGTVVDFDIQKEIEDFCSKKGLLVEGFFQISFVWTLIKNKIVWIYYNRLYKVA